MEKVVTILGVLAAVLLIVYLLVYIGTYNVAVPQCRILGYDLAIVLPDLTIYCWP